MKTLTRLMPALIVLLLFSGCATTKESSNARNENLPTWIDEMPPEDALWGIGAAKMSSDDMSMTMAESRARQAIARQISTVAQGMISDYDKETGIQGENTKFAESVTRQISNTKLEGAIPVKRWKAPDGSWWYLVQYKKSDAARVGNDIIESEAAQYAEYKALEAQKRMDAQLDKMNSKPIRVTE